MRKAIIIFSGFTQGWSKNTGSDKLYMDMQSFQKIDGHDDMVLVYKKEWKDWEKLVEWLNMHKFSEAFVCAYSWGAGYGLREFSKAFDGQITAVLCDPVHRSKWPWMRWKSISSWVTPIVKYGANVKVVKHFTQKLNEPGGDRVVTVQPKPSYITLPYVHQEMDDALEYHKAAYDQVRLWLKSH